MHIPPDLGDFRTRRQGSGGTHARALSAINTFHLGKILAEGGHHTSLVPAVGEIDRADPLDLRAHADTIAAKNALVGIAGDRRRRKIRSQILVDLTETDFLDPEILGKRLEFADRVLVTGCAVLFMAGEQELQRHFAHFADFRRACMDLQPCLRERGTRSDDPPPFHLHDT